ncbi:hypothetical protein WICPIJ_005442 [Wickerhamomyces pijperi]|uniref:Zn(2)-C6 fungal-type domain-containing protein n=1 Tax=Wickerhamomyces pijperi TaxID=599730 RepID=A0A9P8Q5Q0_WICPI|nr:hypothetical protein WICPIJ_005442 [Wickerhamomyces pijperi]
MSEPTNEIPAAEAHLVTQKKQPRKKTARACVNCHRAHMTCDSGRPCKRCVGRGLESTCIDAPRKLKKYMLVDPSDSSAMTSVTPTPTPSVGDTKVSLDTSFGTGLGAQTSNGLSTVGSTLNPHSETNNESRIQPKQQLSHSHGLMNPVPSEPHSHLHRSSLFNPSQVSKAQYNDSVRHSHNSGFNQQYPFAPQPQTQLSPQQQHQQQRRSKFLSNAITNEYFSLGEIIKQEDLHGSSPYPQSTMSPPNLLDTFKSNNNNNNMVSSSLSDTPTPSSSLNNASDLYQNVKPSEKSINQYTLGHIHDRVVTLPDTLELIESEQTLNGELTDHSNSANGGDRALSFTIQLKTSKANSTTDQSLSESGLRFKEAEDIYSKIVKPFSYTPGFHALHKYLQSRFSKPDLMRMAKSIAIYRPSFIACTNTLKEADLIFMEQCFQRTLLEYHKFISISGTPTIVWRRTGQIAYVSEEFCILTGWTREQLLSKMTFIVELMDNISVIEYFDLFSTIAYGDFRGATMTGCTLLTPGQRTVKTTCIWTLKRDVFGIPMMIIGSFLPIL